MKKIFVLLLFSAVCFEARTQSCCLSAETAMYADKNFISKHPSPLPFVYDAKTGKMITFKSPDGKEGSAFEVKGTTPANVILLFHEWWGLNDYIKQEAEKLSAATGATILALDLYDGKVATQPNQASEIMQSLDEERVRAVISGGIDYIGREAKLQTMGWCMGGKWSLQAALMAGPQARGCVMYYGMPEQDPERLAKLSCPVLGIFATEDKHISPEIVSRFEANMKAQNKKLILHNYKADHAFANPSNPGFDKAATADAMNKTLEFLKQNFADTRTR